MAMSTVLLLEMGFEIVGGKLDYKHVNYGQMTPDGPLLTPEGEELVKSRGWASQSEVKRGRPRKAEVEAAPEPAEG